ncbi:MAG: DNA translocase FtsK 4TM domain-containing protein [Anaerolineae bacterium]|nr:DNA translocase FtsK 4TM domain-containing protein [Anaerolineae bacterium]
MSLGLLPPVKGGLTGAINSGLSNLFGWGKIVWPVVSFAIGIWLILRYFGGQMFDIPYFRVIGTLLLYACVLAWVQMIELINDPAPTVEAFRPISENLAIDQGRGGGWFGHQIYLFLLGQLGDFGTFFFLIGWLVVGLMLSFDVSVVEIGQFLVGALAFLRISDSESRAQKRAAREAAKAESVPVARPGQEPTTQQIPLAPSAAAATAGGSAVLATTTKKTASAPPAKSAPPPAKEEQASRSLPVIRRRGASDEAAGDSESQPGAAVAGETKSVTRPLANAKAGDQQADQETRQPSRRRLPHLGQSKPADQEGADQPAAAERSTGSQAIVPAKAETPTQSGQEDDAEQKGRFGFLRRRSKPAGQTGDEPSEEQKTAEAAGSADKTADAQPTAAGQQPSRRSPFARSPADDSGEEASPPRRGIPVPPDSRVDDTRDKSAGDRPALQSQADASSPERSPGLSRRPVSPFRTETRTEAGTSADSADAADQPIPSRPFGRPISQRQRLERTSTGPATDEVASAVPGSKEGDSVESISPSTSAATEEIKPPVRDRGRALGLPARPGTRAHRIAATSDLPADTPDDQAEKPQDEPQPAEHDQPEELEYVALEGADSPVDGGDKAEAQTGSRLPFTSPLKRRIPSPDRVTGDKPDQPVGEAENATKTEPVMSRQPEATAVEKPVEPAPEPVQSPAPVAKEPIPEAQPEDTQEAASATIEAAAEAGLQTKDSAAPTSDPPAEDRSERPMRRLPQPASETAAPAAGAPARAEAPPIRPAINRDARSARSHGGTDGGTKRPVTTARSPAKPGAVQWELPDYRKLLRRGDEQQINDEILLDKARTIEDTLSAFGAPGKVVEVNPGPVITQFGVEPDYLISRSGKRTRVKVGAIARLDADLALAMAAKSIRIEAPVPGKGFVGIEVPNDEVALVSLYDIMDSPEFRRIDSRLRLALGLGVDGTPVAADLTAMPHLLIAGTTGSGKSVCVNAIISAFLLSNTPDELQFIMVDPKRVELTGYNGIPHLVAPVVVDLERIVGVLQWIQREMEERYRKFASITARNILDYNSKIGPNEHKMPYYVVVVDELADLMMLAPDETERLLARLAQMARATGIHLIISTQRPSVDIITGLIKANFPARIAFAVASSVDSRVILDQPGAEKLLGRGDMLYQSPDAAAPLRMQGVFVSDEEINRITNYWKGLAPDDAAAGSRATLVPPSRDMVFDTGPGATGPSSRRSSKPAQPAFWDEKGAVSVTTFPDDGGDGDGTGEDELYGEAVELVQRLNKASISLLQRRLRIGYTRAARLIDLMEQEGIVGPAESGSKPREVIKYD